MFHDFADNTGGRNWTAVFRAIVVSLSEDKCHKSSPPNSSQSARKPAVQKSARQGLHNVQHHEWTFQHTPCCRSAWAQKPPLQGAQIPSPPHKNRHTPAFRLPISNQTLELCPHGCSISRDSTCLQNCTARLDGRMCQITIRISDVVFFLNLFLTLSLTEQNFNQLLILANNVLLHSVESVPRNWNVYIIMKKEKMMPFLSEEL